MLTDARDCRGQVENCAAFGNVLQAKIQSGPAGQNPIGGFQHESGFGMGRGHIDARATCADVDGGHGDNRLRRERSPATW